MATDLNNVLPKFLEEFAEAVATRIATRISPNVTKVSPAGHVAATARNGSAKGQKIDMRCRMPRCFNRSKGPRYGFMCEKHMSASVSEQRKAREAYRMRHAS